MVRSFNQITNEVRKFLYTKFYGMNEENTLTFDEMLEKTAKISMDQRTINGGRTQGYATKVTVLDPSSRQDSSSTDNENSTADEKQNPVEKFREQKTISGNSSFFITIPGTELPEEVYSLTAAQTELQYAQNLGVKFFKHVDKDGVAQYFRAGKVKVKANEKFGEVGKSVYEKLSWPKGITSDRLGKQRPILVGREIRENMPEGVYGSLKLARTKPNLIPIISTALTIGLAISMGLGVTEPGQDKGSQAPLSKDPQLAVEKQVIENTIVNEQDGIALGNVFKLSEGVEAYNTAREAMAGQNDAGQGVAVIGNAYCSTADNYYIDGLAALDKDGKVIGTNFQTYGLTRDEYIQAVAKEKGLNPEELTGIVHYSKVGEGVSLDEKGNMVYDRSTNTGWVNQKTQTVGGDTFLVGAKIQGNLEQLNMLTKTQTNSNRQAYENNQVNGNGQARGNGQAYENNQVNGNGQARGNAQAHEMEDEFEL